MPTVEEIALELKTRAEFNLAHETRKSVPLDPTRDPANILALIADWERLRKAMEPFAQFGGLRKAMEPFAQFGRPDIPEDNLRPQDLMRDRVCDWFGVSDFDRARAALNPTPET